MTEPAPPFRRRARQVVTAVAVLLALALVIVLVTPAPEPGATAAADSFSRSAVGHAALVAFLRDQGVPVEIARGRSQVRRSDVSVWSLEPPIGEPLTVWEGEEGAIDVWVLPKWQVESEAGRDRVAHAELLPSSDVEALLPATRLERRSERATCDQGVELSAPQLVHVDPVELVGDFDLTMTPLLRCGDATLVARLDGPVGSHIVITDPDLLNNWGIGAGRNADVVLDLAKQLGKPIVIDESIHGYGPSTSLLAELRQFPLNLVVIHVAVLAAVTLWAGVRRFGPVKALPPRLPPGGETLAWHAAGLLTESGSPHWTVEQSWARARHRLAELFHHVDDPESIVRLDAIAKVRGLSERASAIDADVRTAVALGSSRRGRSRHSRSLFTLIQRISDFERSLTRDA